MQGEAGQLAAARQNPLPTKFCLLFVLENRELKGFFFFPINILLILVCMSLLSFTLIFTTKMASIDTLNSPTVIWGLFHM